MPSPLVVVSAEPFPQLKDCGGLRASTGLQPLLEKFPSRSESHSRQGWRGDLDKRLSRIYLTLYSRWLECLTPGAWECCLPIPSCHARCVTEATMTAGCGQRCEQICSHLRRASRQPRSPSERCSSSGPSKPNSSIPNLARHQLVRLQYHHCFQAPQRATVLVSSEQ